MLPFARALVKKFVVGGAKDTLFAVVSFGSSSTLQLTFDQCRAFQRCRTGHASGSDDLGGGLQQRDGGTGTRRDGRVRPEQRRARRSRKGGELKISPSK